MNFEQAIKPLTEFLLSRSFLIQLNRPNLIEFSSKTTTIRIGYSHFEYTLNIWVGQSTNMLTELTPALIEEVFEDSTFKFQSTLTVDNILYFLKGPGKALLSRDIDIICKLDDYSIKASRNYTLQINTRQNIERADKAWIEKDYANFIKYLDQVNMDLLPQSYHKKYKIAVDKSKD